METSLLTQSAQRVQNALLEKGLSFKVVELPDSTRTAQEASAAIGCNVAQIVKSLIFKTKESQKPILVLASGPQRVNEKTIQGLVGEKIEKADAEFARRITGFAIGGIPPIGHKEPIEWVFIDKDLVKCEEIWAAAGTPHAVFSLKGKDLLDLTAGKAVAIC